MSAGTDATTVSTSSASTETGLDENIAGALAYVLGLISGIAFYVLESDNQFVRFQAAQSIVVSITLIALAFVFSILSFVLGFVLPDALGILAGIISTLGSLGVSLVGFALWLFLMYKAYSGDTYRVPVLAGVADSLL